MIFDSVNPNCTIIHNTNKNLIVIIIMLVLLIINGTKSLIIKLDKRLIETGGKVNSSLLKLYLISFVIVIALMSAVITIA